MQSEQEKYEALTTEEKIHRIILETIERLTRVPKGGDLEQVKHYTLHRYAVEVLRGILLHAMGDRTALEAALPKQAPVEPWRPTHEMHIRLVDPETGHKIKRIKVVRQMTGMGLKESKDLVESAPCKVCDVDPDKDVPEWFKACEETLLDFHENFKLLYRGGKES